MQRVSAVNFLVVTVLVLSGILVFVAWLPYPGSSKEIVSVNEVPENPVVQNTQEDPSFQDTNDLDSATMSLDSTDLDTMDSELSKFDLEASF